MNFAARQAGLLGLLILSILVATSASGVLGGTLLPLFVGAPIYLNPVILLAIILFGGLGLLTLLRAKDSGWPAFMLLLGLWSFVIAFEDSIIQWFTIQRGALLSGGRINVIQMTTIMVAFALGVQLHVNMLGRRLRIELSDRGLDKRELAAVEDQARQTSLRILMRLVPIIAVAAVVLFVAQFIVGGLRLGLGTIGILSGLVIVAVLIGFAFDLLRKGPVPEWTKPREPKQQQPPRGLR